MSFASLFAALLASTLLQAEPPAETPTELGDVIVDGRPIDQRVRSFVDEVIAAPNGRGPARWSSRICVGAVNFRNDAAQFMVDRISQVAVDIGLDIGEPGCRPNILVIGSSDGAGFARGLVEARPAVFRPGGSGMTLDRAALDAFQSGQAPVRWWHVAVPTNADTGQIATRMPGYEPPVISSTVSSRLRTRIRNDLNRVIVIVDVNRATGKNFAQLADYVAMVSFSQVDADADISGYDSILNLFTQSGSTALTGWDRDYLHALYSAELDRASPVQQAGEIQRLMARRERNAAESDGPQR